MINRRQFLITTGAALAAANMAVGTSTADDLNVIVLEDWDGDKFTFTRHNKFFWCKLGPDDKYPRFPFDVQDERLYREIERGGLAVTQYLSASHWTTDCLEKKNSFQPVGMEWFGFGDTRTRP